MPTTDNLKTKFRDWFEKTLSENAKDIAEHGADAGFTAIIYTYECVELYEQFENDIWDMLYDDYQEFGYRSIPEFIATFSRIDMTETPDQFKNILVWYACERLAREAL